MTITKGHQLVLSECFGAFTERHNELYKSENVKHLTSMLDFQVLNCVHYLFEFPHSGVKYVISICNGTRKQIMTISVSQINSFNSEARLSQHLSSARSGH